MPRTGRGGNRVGTPGVQYTNRTDLNQNRQAATAATGQPYGQRAQQIAAQKAVPLPAPPPVQAPTNAGAPLAAPVGPAPGLPFNRPTDRPNEPLTAGLPIGAGAGPEALSGPAMLSADDLLVAKLRGLYAAYPSSDVARLLEQAQARAQSSI